MMLGLATATIVESSKIMKKPTIAAHNAFQGFTLSARGTAAPLGLSPPGRP
jgi:hypothetical protein